MDAWDVAVGWRMLDRRMLLVHPVREVGRFLPALVGFALFGRSTDAGGLWGLFGLVVPVGLGLARYLTTSYRITESRVEVRRGLLTKRVVSAPLDRVRTVEITASPIHRLLGLTTVRIGTGRTTDKGEEKLALDGLGAPVAAELRDRLLRNSPIAASPGPALPDAPPDVGDGGHPGTPIAQPRVVLRLDLAWVRFAPLTTSGIVIAGAALGLAAQSFHTLAVTTSVHVGDLERLGSLVLAVAGVVVLVLLFCVLAVVGYLLTNFGFVLTRRPDDDTWHLRRGLLTTRETTLDHARTSGISIGEPLGLRLAHGARLTAIVTGLTTKQKGSAVLVPPAPRAEVDRVAVEVLGTPGPVTADLVRHSTRAHRRRWTRAMVPGGVLALVSLVVAYAVSWAFVAVAVLVLAAAAFMAHDRWQALGHALVDGHLVARSGSLDRRREVLHTRSVIGWNFRASWFQRRAGLTDLTATAAGGRQRVSVLDLDEARATALAVAGTPGLLDPFLA
jgi:putative membrane protein